MNPNVTATTLLILSVALFFTVADVNNKKITALKDKSEEYDIAVQQSNLLKSKRDSLLEKYRNIEPENLDKVSKLIPDSIDNIRLILEMMKLSGEFGVDIKSVQISMDNLEKPEEPAFKNNSARLQSNPKYNSALVTFGLITTYEDFQTFLRGLQNNLRLMDVMSISFTSAANDKYSFSVIVKTYWLPE